MKIVKLAVLAALAAAPAACSAMDEGMTIDVAASVSPGANATGVSRTTAITMDAGMVMDTAACRDRMVLHLGDSAGAVVPATVTWANDNRTMVLTPAALLAPLTTYFVHVRDSMMTPGGTMGGGMMGGGMMSGNHGMMMLAPQGGMRLGDGMGWSFTTGN